MFNEFPYTNYEKINLDWLLDLGNKLKADAESGEFDGERGKGIFGITTIYAGGAVGEAGYYCNKIGDAGVGDFVIGYGPTAGVNTLYLMKITSVNGNYLEGTTLLQITGSQGPQGKPGPQGEPGEVTQEEFDELSVDVGDLKSAVNKTELLYINVLDYGATRDGSTDSTSAFNQAIAAANLNMRGIFIPDGRYRINGQLDPVWCGCHIMGVGGAASNTGGTIIEDRRTGWGKYLIEFSEVGQGRVDIGGGVSDITFLHFGSGHTGCIFVNKEYSGWDARYERVKITGYPGTAMRFKSANDTKIINCMITECGGFYGTYQEFAVVLQNNTNAITFIGCHFEHCRYDISISDTCFGIIFDSCKFEQSTKDVVSNDVACININSATNQNVAQFNGCLFVNVDMDNYLKETDTDYSNVPYMLSCYNSLSGGIVACGCVFTCGYGSGNYQAESTDIGQARFVKSFSAVITGCVFIYAAWAANSILFASGEFGKNNILTSCTFRVNTEGNSLGATGTKIVSGAANVELSNNVLVKLEECNATIS